MSRYAHSPKGHPKRRKKQPLLTRPSVIILGLLAFAALIFMRGGSDGEQASGGSMQFDESLADPVTGVTVVTSLSTDVSRSPDAALLSEPDGAKMTAPLRRVLEAGVVSPATTGQASILNDCRKWRRAGWRWCYIKGNVRIVREVLNTPEFSLPDLDPRKGQLGAIIWGLADETNRHVYKMFRRVENGMRINHVPGVQHLGNKRLLTNAMRAAGKLHGEQYFNFFPLSFTVPRERKALINYVNTNRGDGRSWILKSAGKDRGLGIELVPDVSQLDPKAKGVMQTYVLNAHVVNGYKYTLRIYVLITSVNPLRLYIYDEGFVHMATTKYSTDPDKLNDRYMHLTNPDLHKARPFYKKNPRPFYWKVSEWRDYLDKEGADSAAVWKRMKSVILRSVLGVEHTFTRLRNDLVKEHDSTFELMGYDFLFDTDLKPYLLEVNPDPSMEAGKTFLLAEEVKRQVLHDTLKIVGVRRAERSAAYRAARQQLAMDVFRNGVSAVAPNCAAAAATSCNILDEEEGDVVAYSELEYHRRGGWDRIYPAYDDTYDKTTMLFKSGAPNESDKQLRCWELAMKQCGLR